MELYPAGTRFQHVPQRRRSTRAMGPAGPPVPCPASRHAIAAISRDGRGASASDAAPAVRFTLSPDASAGIMVFGDRCACGPAHLILDRDLDPPPNVVDR